MTYALMTDNVDGHFYIADMNEEGSMSAQFFSLHTYHPDLDSAYEAGQVWLDAWLTEFEIITTCRVNVTTALAMNLSRGGLVSVTSAKLENTF